MAFIDRLLPAPLNGGFRMDGYWVWCGSVIKGDDNRYHMFASRWPSTFLMHPGWVFYSQIVRASSDTPEGPYTFEEVVFERRDPSYFDGRMTHNPTIHKHGDTYLLFYTGCTYQHDVPELENQVTLEDPRYKAAWNNKRIGVAWSKSVFGPWNRPDSPILEPRPGKWDGSITSNPAPCVMPDGKVYILYKSSTQENSADGPFMLGIACADNFKGPYRRLSEEPILKFDDPEQHVEDPYLWHENGEFNAIMKDMAGGITGEEHSGLHATSKDCIHWTVSSPAIAYRRKVKWEDGTESIQGSFERPQLLIQDGKPTHLFAATANGPGYFWRASETWNMVTPLRQ